MTREEAKYHLEWIPHFDEEKFVDEIYDDIESRVCGNCKHGIKQNGYESSYMCIKLSTEEYGSLFFDMPFGCTEFEVEPK